MSYRARLTRPRLFGLLGSTVITTDVQPSAQSALIELVALTMLTTGKNKTWLDRIEVAPSRRFERQTRQDAA